MLLWSRFRVAALRAVPGSSVVYLLVGLKYYVRVWRELWPRIMSDAIEARKRTNARFSTSGPMTEESPFKSLQQKGGDPRAAIYVPFRFQPGSYHNAHTFHDEAIAEQVRALAEDPGAPADDIKAALEEAIAQLEWSATIKDYLPLLATRRVRARLKKRVRRRTSSNAASNTAQSASHSIRTEPNAPLAVAHQALAPLLPGKARVRTRIEAFRQRDNRSRADGEFLGKEWPGADR
jgi:hypothetical protein